MKTVVKICGVGRKKGVSKAGKPYEFIEISGTVADATYDYGVKCVNYAVQPDLVQDVTLEVGREISVFSHFFNGKTYVDAVM